MEPGPTTDIQNPLEAAVEERWARYLEEGIQETADLKFSTPSWAGTASRPHLLSGQPDSWHLMEADSVPPGFSQLDRKTQEEQEAVTKYRTPAESKELSVDEELGAENVTTIGDDWFAPTESEVASAVKNLLDLTQPQPMDVDPGPEEREYQIFDTEESDVLGPFQQPGSPITTEENRVLDMPGGFSRAPGNGRPPTGSPAGPSGRRITG